MLHLNRERVGVKGTSGTSRGTREDRRARAMKTGVATVPCALGMIVPSASRVHGAAAAGPPEDDAAAGDAWYSDLVVLPDMSIGLLYETNATGWQSIWFARFTLEWLTDGKDKIVPKARTEPESPDGVK